MRSDPSRLLDPIRGYDPAFSGLVRVLDACVAGGGLWLAAYAHGVEHSELYTLAAACAALLYLLLAERRGLYRSWRTGGLRQEVGQLALTWVGTSFGLLALGYLTNTGGDFSRRILLAWCAVGLPVLVATRVVLRGVAALVRSTGGNQRRAAIAGANELGQRVAGTIESEPWMGIRFAGFYDESSSAGASDDAVGRPKLGGSLRDLVEDARRGEIDLVYLTLPMREEERIRELVRELSTTRVSVYLVPDLLAFSLLRSRWFTLGAIPTVTVFDRPLTGLDRLTKRVEDVVLAALVLTLSALPMLGIALALRLTSGAPVIFKQRRYGWDGREITVWKFRSMSVCEDGGDFLQARRGDPRITRLGAILRATSLDELPQFLNVLQGRMSVVGPRPHPVLLDDQLKDRIDWYMLRNRVKPGITGWAQVHGFRGETDTLDKMQKRIDHDLEYIRRWSIGLDLKIVALTVFKGLVNKNAY